MKETSVKFPAANGATTVAKRTVKDQGFKVGEKQMFYEEMYSTVCSTSRTHTMFFGEKMSVN